MSLKAELETWAAALKAYEAEDFAVAMGHFEKIADTSKVCWNIGIILATLGRHHEAVDRFQQATEMDMYFTIAYQQKGVSNFMIGRYDQAHRDFENALLYMRGNQTINYEQLGLDFKLFSAEVLFNCGLAKIYLGQVADGMQDLRESQTRKQSPEHAVIDDAVRDQGRDYNVFSVPVGVLFKPPAAKLNNLAARDYMGKAVLVAASDVNDAYTTFTGITRLRRGQTPTGAPLDSSHPLGRSASVGSIDTTGLNVPPPAGRVGRSNSVANVSGSPFQPLVAPRPPPKPASPPPTLQRSMTTVRPSIPPLDTELPTFTSVASFTPSGKSGRDSPQLRTPPPPQTRSVATLRVTELYDDYYTDDLDQDIPELPPIGGRNKQLEAWTVKTPFGAPPGRSPSVRQPPSSFNGRGLSRAPSRQSGTGTRDSRYEGESEAGSYYDMSKVRIKVHVGKTVRGMAIYPDDTYNNFCSALRSKFPELGRSIVVNFRDEDGEMLSMQDEGDYEAAIDVARVTANGRAEGKLEIWVE